MPDVAHYAVDPEHTIASLSDWAFDDFGDEDQDPNANSKEAKGDDGLPPTGESQQLGRSQGPFFEQRQLSMVGDAAVVLGDCYHLLVRASERTDGGQDACLIPPVQPKLFPMDSHVSLNLSVCPSKSAPFHTHDTQPAGIPIMLCFDECHRKNTTKPPEDPLIPDWDALRIANCTRTCFQSCTRPLASDCTKSCAAENYTCFAECHRAAKTCSIPMGPRNFRDFDLDPNQAICYTEHAGYKECVGVCNLQCHEDLRLSKRTVEDDINDWYNESCTPPLALAAASVGECFIACEMNCSSLCNETITFPLGPELGLGPALTNCTRNCTAGCYTHCFNEDASYDYEAGCRPPAPYNCTDNCLGWTCGVVSTFCSVYDTHGTLRHADPNCTFGFNVTFQTAWGNRSVEQQLSDPNSQLSLLVGVNATKHTCYNVCDNNTLSSQFFFHGSALQVGLNCTTYCFDSACMQSCLHNCSVEEELSLLPPCIPGPDCISPTNCSVAVRYGNCSASKAFESVRINITAVTFNQSAWVPPWDQDVCESIVGEAVDAFRSCISTCHEQCEVACPLPPNVSTLLIEGVLYNDTSGACLRDCHLGCAYNCSTNLSSSIDHIWCVPPEQPIDYCTPPQGCIDDCEYECFDPTFLIGTDPDCEEYKDKQNADGSNMTVVALPYAYNISQPVACSRNMSIDQCPDELKYYNVTQYSRDIVVSEGCIKRCLKRCVERCFSWYCTTRLEVPANDTATCLPRCLARFFEPDFAADMTDASSDSALQANITLCTSTCNQACVTARKSNCTARCEPIIQPEKWEQCYTDCYANNSARCAKDCTYDCTGNHTLAYGFEAPYDATEDYLTSNELRNFIVEEDVTSLGGYTYHWSNASEDCYSNCSHHCAGACFQRLQDAGDCRQELQQAAKDREAAGLADLHPREVAVASNNCTLHRSAACLDGCQVSCTRRCANRTDVVPAEVQAAQDYEVLYDTYVSSCEAKCKSQIYGQRVTTEELCLAYTPTYREDCLNNCTEDARIACANPNITIDIVDHCNSTCIHLYVDTSSMGKVGNASEQEGRFNFPPPPPIGSLNDDYYMCMGHCQGNYTQNPEYLCDGGRQRAEALEAAETFYAMAEAGLGLQGITPAEQLEIDRLRAAIPKGEVCNYVDLGCVYNNTLGCDEMCAEQIAYYHKLCVYRATARRNATFEYNISSCMHPDGWRVGTEKWRYFAGINASGPLAQPDAHKQYPLWSYADVEDQVILNCSCHFHNETFDPEFVAAVLEYEMRPFRGHYVSTCLCLYNATEGEPQHCVHSNHSDIMKTFDWVFGNGSLVEEEEDVLGRVTDELVQCGSHCIDHCVAHCGAYFVEHVAPETNNGSMYLHRYNDTFRYTGYPSSLTDWNISNVITPGHWRSLPECFNPCMQTCAVTNCTRTCSSDCLHSPNDNETALAFGCFWNSTDEDGLPLCQQFCGCHSSCATECIHELSTLNTSTLMIERLPMCLGNCTDGCLSVHDERCSNISAMLAAAWRPKYINQTAICLTRIYPTCAHHCLGISIQNTTVNNSLFHPSELPLELLALNVTAGFDPNADEGYQCVLEPCDLGMNCNQTALQIGEREDYDPVSGNTTIVPIFTNVSTRSIEGCKANRSTACLETCTMMAYLICVPPEDPFDICVRSCVANLTYEEPPYVFDHSLAVCKKKLRLTPAEPAKSGAVWHKQRQRVGEGFSTKFAFKFEHPSKRCQTVAHPSHEERPENAEIHCKGRGGDGFAFVVQDAGQTSFESDCAFSVAKDCVDGEAAVCAELCYSLCPERVAAEHSQCNAACLRGNAYTMPATSTSLNRITAAEQVATAGASCAAHVGECVSACDEHADQLVSGLAMAPGGCLRDCLDAGAQLYCEARCPLVDEDLDDACIDACKAVRLNSSLVCYNSCNTSCAAQATVENAQCREYCLGTDALMPSGDTVGRCRSSALAHPNHDSALCLTGCRHTDETCLLGCAQTPPNSLINCVGACPQNNTLCVAQCLDRRLVLGKECIYPQLIKKCNHTSAALGEGASGVGYANLRNTIAVKFDTWYNSNHGDPWASHIAVHSGGSQSGASADSSEALALAYDFDDIGDGLYHEAHIEYVPSLDMDKDIGEFAITPMVANAMENSERGRVGTLSVHLDGRRVLQVPLHLPTLLDLKDGKAYVGFTGATGSAYQEHSIMAWHFNESGKPGRGTKD